MKPEAHCFTIPAELPFLKTLAAWVIERHGREAETLSRAWILLPNRRACRALRDVFLEITHGQPLLLPRIRPIGDLDEDDLPPDLLAHAAVPDLPPAIASERRLLLLARLVMQFGQKQGVYSPAQAVELARQLTRFLDDMAREGLDIHQLSSLAPAEPKELAEHWQQVLAFLHIISHRWPEALAEEEATDVISRRNRLLAALAEHWQKTPPDTPVIAAGSTGTQPATAKLLATIARLPHGAVILPGLDKEMPDAEWDVVEATHPQYPLKTLLERLNISRRDIPPLSAESSSARKQCLRAAFQPPLATAGWTKMELPLEGMKNMHLCEADTLLDEARLIAIVLRETLETPEKTAALITHDRRLARMVAAQMERFGIGIDDSAGKPLLATPTGSFLRLVLEMVASRAAPVSLLAMLRHPLAAAGREPVECRRLSRVMEKKLLRGVRLTSGWQALHREAAAKKEPALCRLLEDLEKETRKFSLWLAKNASVPTSEIITEHMRLAEWLATTDKKSGAENLWAGDDGNQLAATLAQLVEHADAMPDIAAMAYPAWFEAMLGADIFRPRFGQHPRLSILSPMEARLLQYDRVILSGLNEKSWPEHPAADPWMSRPMRHAFGLPPLERAIGQSAHDFFMLATSPEVILTRARKVNGKPTIPSRWLVRLETLIKGKNPAVFSALADGKYYVRAVEQLEEPVLLPPLERPQPIPPLMARPKEISVTDFDLWQRDPYALYAKRVLGLKQLDPLDQEPDAAEFGNAVHEACSLFTQKWPQALPKDAHEELLAAGRKVFAKYEKHPAIFSLWWPRFETMAAWLVTCEQERRVAGITVQSEQELRWQATPEFLLKARVDRIETDKNENVIIADYKTGEKPSQTDAEKGLSNQLQLEALMLLANARAKAVIALEYWKLAGREEDCRIIPLKKTDELIEACRQRLDNLIKDYGNPKKSFAAQDNASLRPRYNDYEHLTRIKEWGEV